MSESALPPEERARVTQFNPLDLDRTVIAVPLLREMKEEVARIEQMAVLSPESLGQFNAAIEYATDFPGGIRAARAEAQRIAQSAAVAATKASETRVSRATEETRAREERRHADLLAAIGELTVEPPLPKLPVSLARLHASI